LNYFQHNAQLTNPKEVALDVIEFDQPQHTGIEVEETRFAGTAELLAHIARETGRAP
jgi:hypothetical protein